MSSKKIDGGEAVLAKIDSYPDDFKSIAIQIHKAIIEDGKLIYPRLWYGMPGYAKSEKGPVLVYFRKDKYITFGQTENSNVTFKDGKPCPVAWYFEELTAAVLLHIQEVVGIQ